MDVIDKHRSHFLVTDSYYQSNGQTSECCHQLVQIKQTNSHRGNTFSHVESQSSSLSSMY
jgi:hypothetical protein